VPEKPFLVSEKRGGQQWRYAPLVLYLARSAALRAGLRREEGDFEEPFFTALKGRSSFSLRSPPFSLRSPPTEVGGFHRKNKQSAVSTLPLASSQSRKNQQIGQNVVSVGHVRF
jgi:hypothetical protein